MALRTEDNRRGLAVLIALAMAMGACSNGQSNDTAQLENALLQSGDLPPGRWHERPVPASPTDDSSPGLCGAPGSRSVPQPADDARASYAIDDEIGPIIGLRNERYARGEAAERLSVSQRRSTPCTWTEGPTTWRLERVDLSNPPTPDIAAFAITNAAGGLATTYEIAMRRGDVLVLASLSTIDADDRVVDELAAALWRRASTHLPS